MGALVEGTTLRRDGAPRDRVGGQQAPVCVGLQEGAEGERNRRPETVKAEKQSQVEVQERRLKELAPAVKNMERLAADFSADPEEILPEAGTLESAKSYWEKKAPPCWQKSSRYGKQETAADLRRLYKGQASLWLGAGSGGGGGRQAEGTGGERPQAAPALL